MAVGFRQSERGTFLTVTLIAVALFAALSYAFLRGTKSNVAWISNEKSKASATSSQDCTNSINAAVQRLTARGCGSRISSNLDGSNGNVGAPTDGSCSIYHMNGGGVRVCGYLNDPSCDLTKLSNPGQRCGGVVYAGIVSGRRIYTTESDAGLANWNNGSSNWTVTSATSPSDGLANTNILIALTDAGAPYAAALLCRSIGPKWYLPSSDEVAIFNTNRTAIGNFFDGGAWNTSGYWTSTEDGNQRAWANYVAYPALYGFGANKNFSPIFRVRCARRD